MAQAGDLPAERFGVQLVEEQDGYLDCYAVALGGVGACASDAGGGGVFVAQVEGQFAAVGALHPLAGELGVVVVGGFLVDELFGVEVQVVVVFETCLLPPLVEGAHVGDVGGDACVVEGEEYGVVYAQVAAAQACFEFFDFGEGALVAQVELVLGVPLAFDEGGLDEQFAGCGGVYAGVLHGAVGVDGQAEEGTLGVGDCRAGAERPVRFGVLHADEVLADFFDPLRVDGGVGARPQAGGFDEFGGEHPVGALFEQAGAGEDCELGAARAEVFAGAAGAPLGVLLAFFLDTHVREQAGEQALVDVDFVGGGVDVPAAAGVNVGGAAHFA